MTTRTRWAIGFGSAGLAAGLALGVTGLAGAASPSPSPGTPSQPHTRAHTFRGFGGLGAGPFLGRRLGLGGLVSSVAGNTLSIRTPRGIEKVVLTSSTAYLRGSSKVTKGALTPGEVVRVRLVDPRATTLTAAEVAIVPAELSGYVTAVGSDTIILTDLSGFTRTVRTSDSTSYVKDGASSTRAAITVGAFVRAAGAVDADGTTLDATRVATGQPAAHPGFGPPNGQAPFTGPGPDGPPAGGPSGPAPSEGGSTA
jgi:hypothetical protein